MPRRAARGVHEASLSIDEFYVMLHPTVPQFSDHAKPLVARQAAEEDPPELPIPLPLEIVPDEAAHDAFFPNGAEPDPQTPLGAAYLWWAALLRLDEYRVAIGNLSANPAVWGDYTSAAAELDGWSMMQNVHYCGDAPDEIAYVKFMPDPGWSMRAFDDAPLRDAQILTVVRCPDGWWRVWGLSRNYVPSANRVRYGSE